VEKSNTLAYSIETYPMLRLLHPMIVEYYVQVRGMGTGFFPLKINTSKAKKFGQKLSATFSDLSKIKTF